MEEKCKESLLKSLFNYSSCFRWKTVNNDETEEVSLKFKLVIHLASWPHRRTISHLFKSTNVLFPASLNRVTSSCVCVHKSYKSQYHWVNADKQKASEKENIKCSQLFFSFCRFRKYQWMRMKQPNDSHSKISDNTKAFARITCKSPSCFENDCSASNLLS